MKFSVENRPLTSLHSTYPLLYFFSFLCNVVSILNEFDDVDEVEVEETFNGIEYFKKKKMHFF